MASPIADHAPTHGMALERDAERDRPEPAGRDVRGMMRVPPVTRHLAAIGARGLDMQPLDGARDLGDQVGPLACESQRFDEQHQPVGSHHAIDHRARVGLGRARPGRRFFGTLGDVEDVATRGLDEQRLLGAEVVGDLARKGIGRAGDRGDGGAVEAMRLEQLARRVEQARAHALAGAARRARTVAGRAIAGRGDPAACGREALRARAPGLPLPSSLTLAKRALRFFQSCLYIIQTRSLQTLFGEGG